MEFVCKQRRFLSLHSANAAVSGLKTSRVRFSEIGTSCAVGFGRFAGSACRGGGDRGRERERDYNQLVSERRLFSSDITSTGELSIWDRAHVSNHPTLPLIPGG